MDTLHKRPTTERLHAKLAQRKVFKIRITNQLRLHLNLVPICNSIAYHQFCQLQEYSEKHFLSGDQLFQTKIFTTTDGNKYFADMRKTYAYLVTNFK